MQAGRGIRDTDRPWGFHAGLWELGANLLNTGIISLYKFRKLEAKFL
ncbi:MAG: hypothetical protein O7C70_07855 [Candidatus Dadabacteria bacterium]|nr:hypothetical protein [Candidatus Dadabacteria bacterium]